MDSCRLPNYHQQALELLSIGTPLEAVLNVIKARAIAHQDADLLKKLNEALPKEKAVEVLTEDDKNNLAVLWDEVKEKLTDEQLTSTKSTAKVIQSILGDEKSEQFLNVLRKQGIKLERRLENRRQHVEFLEKIRNVHKTLGDDDLVAQLDEDIAVEEARIERRQENLNALETRSEGLISTEALLRDFLYIAEIIDKNILTETEVKFSADYDELEKKIRATTSRMQAYEAKLKQLTIAVKSGPKDKRAAAKERLAKFKEENKEKYKEDKKAFPKLIREAQKLKVTQLAQEIKDRTGKSIANRVETTQKLLDRLEKQLEKAQVQMMEMGIASFASDAKDIKLSSEQILANQQRLSVVATEGANLRVQGFREAMEHFGTDTIGINEAEEAFGEFAIKTVIKDRERVKLPDGSETDDISPLNMKEIEKAAQIWKSQMIATYDGGFFSEDSALMSEEAINVIEAIALGKDLVDGSTPDAVDPSFSKTMSSQEIASKTNLGTIPARNRFKTHQEAGRALESSIRRLQTIFGFKYFNNVITEKVLRQILHSQLMDIHPNAFEEARIKAKNKRNLATVTQEERLALVKGVLLAHGANLDLMPEFTDKEWATDNSKLISFDIETNGTTFDEVYCIQIHRYDASDKTSIKRETQIWVNDGTNLINSKSADVPKREPLTKAQIDQILGGLEADQNNGFKVITHNGNSYDFGKLGDMVTDKNLLARVALRSIDTLANITSQVPEVSWSSKQRQPGKKLKDLLRENLPPRSETTLGYGGRIRFTNSYPIDVKTDTPIKLDESGITNLWKEANETGDWYKFDAYSENDADLTIGLYLHLADPSTKELTLRAENSTEARVIDVRPAVSNLWLNNEQNVTNLANPIDSMSNLSNLTPQMQTWFEGTYMTESIGYDANMVYDTLVSWWLGVLTGDPKSNESKITQLVTQLKKRSEQETITDSLLVDIADQNQRAVQPLLEDKFTTYGFVLKLSYSTDTADTDLVTINDQEDSNLVTADLKNNGASLFRNSTRSAEIYEQAIIESFISTITDPMIKNRFFKALERNVKPRNRRSNETKQEYWTDVINTFLKEHIPGYTDLRQFGNAELDWKPADEVGIAIAQIIMDQKPGITVVDTLVQRGETLQTLQTMDEQAALRNQTGRKKIYATPDRNKVHMAQPHELSKEERAYESFRLKQRVRHILRLKIENDSDRESIWSFITAEMEQKEHDPISFSLGEQIIRVLPDVAVRHPFSFIPNLEQKARLVHENLYQIPRLLMSFNHDCSYMGLNAPPRFLSDAFPVFYLSDVMSAGGPTAAAFIGGAIDQLAHMTSYGLVGPEGIKELERVLERAFEILDKHGPTAFDPSNKSDYKYNGKHNILAMLVAFQEGSEQIWDDMLTALGATDEKGGPPSIRSSKLIVNGKELADPRFILFDLLAGKTEGTDKTTGILEDIENNPTKYNMDEDDKSLAASIRRKLGGTRSESVKNFLKGAITPRLYEAGVPGILEGLKNKNEELENPMTEEEIEFLTHLMARTQPGVNGLLIDKAIGISAKQRSALKELLLQRGQRLTANRKENLKSTLVTTRGARQVKSQAERLTSLSNWLDKAISLTTDSLARSRFGPFIKGDSDVEQYKKKVRQEILTDYKDRLQAASEYWDTKAVESMTAKEYNAFIYDMNVILSGGEEAAKNHLVIWALNRRASTPHVLMDDVVDLQQFVMGVHIDKDDYVDYLNRELYFRYGIENASGRNHMVAWYGFGPEGPKYSQPRVLEGKEKNPFGIWDIKEMPNETDFDDLFLRQTLLDLAKFYLPPNMSMDTESREMYFRQLENRSNRELVAVELSKYIDQMPEGRRFTVNGQDISVEERNKRNRRAARTAAQRIRMRTALPQRGDIRETITLDSRVPGFGALRPLYADIDFTQRGIYALSRAQHSMRIKNNRFNQILQSAKENATSDPNNFVSPQFRGYESGYQKEHMPHIPMASTDIMGALTLGEKSKQEQIAIRLQNVLTQFALTNGLDSLLEAKDWARIYYIMKIKEKALIPAIKSLQKTTEDETGLQAATNEEILREARVRFFDGFLKVVGVSSVTLSGMKRFSTIDMMATLEERRLTIEDIQNIKKEFGETPGWLNVLTYLSQDDRIERLMPLQFGVTIDPGVVARYGVGRRNIKETTNLPVTAFGREILQIYHIVMSSDLAKRVATRLIDGTEYETDPNLQRDAAGFVILESLDPQKNRKLYRQIWTETIKNKQDLSEEMLKSGYYFVLDSSDRLRIVGDKPILREDESKVALTTQGPTDSTVQVRSMVDNPGTLWLYTPEMLIGLLNNLENYNLFADFELAIQTNKEIYGFKTKLDQIMQEEEAQLFEQLRDDEEEINEALLFLHKMEPGKVKPNILEDYRKTTLAGLPKRVIDVGSYLRVETKQDRTRDEKPENAVAIKVRVRNELNAITEVDVLVETADMPYFLNILRTINYANKLGFTEEALKLGTLLVELVNESVDAPKGVKTTNFAVKALSLTAEVFGNPDAEDNAMRFVLTSNKIPRNIRKLQSKIREGVEIMNLVMNNDPHELKREFYIATEMMQKMGGITSDIASDTNFIAAVSLAAGTNDVAQTRKQIQAAFEELQNDPVEPEIANEEYATTESPIIYTQPEDFVNSFANPAHRAIANKLIDSLQDLVVQGIISQRAMDMKLMLIGSLSRYNPEIITELGFEYNTGANGESLMSASKKAGRYTIGLNITAMRITPENELIFRFAEELVHLARVKFVKTNSDEWNRVVGIYSTNRSEDIVRQLLIAMNQGKPLENIEQQVQYAMDNSDEFFAHIGAFFLLREVLGVKNTLDQLENRFKAVSSSLSIWRRAFYQIKGMSKRILTTFARLRNDPAYSALFLDAEDAVMSIIGKGLAGRVDVGNEDAHFNAFKSVTTTVNNKMVNPADIVKIQVLQQKRTQNEQQLRIEQAKPVATRDSTLITTLQQEDRMLTAEIKKLDAVTFMGKTVSEVSSDIEKLTDYSFDATTGTTRRITRRVLKDMGVQRSFITHLVQQGVIRRGTRSDYGWSVGGGLRKLLPEKAISKVVQGIGLASWNGSQITYNSPFAPMVVLSDLIDETAVTTSGSFASDIGGLENMKYMLDPHTLNVMRLWSELTSEFPYDKAKHLALLQDTVRYLQNDPANPMITTNSFEIQLVQNLGDGIKLLNDRIKDLMVQTMMTERADSLDTFPLRLRNFELLDPEARTEGYSAIKNALRKKQLDALNTQGEKAVFSSLAMYVGGIIPLEMGLAPANDINFVNKVRSDIISGTPTVAQNAREAMLNYFIRQAAQNAIGHASASGTTIISSAAYVNTRSAVDIFKDVQDLLGQTMYRVREGNISFEQAFPNMNADDLAIIIDAYQTLLENPTNTELKNRWQQIISTDDRAREYFSLPNRKIPLLPESFESMEGSDILALDFLSKCGVSSHLFPTDSFHLNSRDIFGNKPTNPDETIMLQLFDTGVDSLFKSLSRGTGYDAIERMHVQRVVGIPGAYFNLTQIFDMFESELASRNAEGISNFYLLDGNGVRQQEHNKHELMAQSLSRLRLGLDEARGTLTRSDLQLGQEWAWLNSLAKMAVLLRFGANLNTATYMVEGVTSLFGIWSSYGNASGIFKGFIDMLFFGKDVIIEGVSNKIRGFGDAIPGRDSQKKLKFYPLKRRKIRKLAMNSLVSLDEVTSPMLPNNLHSTDPTSDVVEAMSFIDRWKLHRSRVGSQAMKSVRVSMDAAANRKIMRLLRNGRLAKFKQAYLNRGRFGSTRIAFQSQAEIQQFLESNKLTDIDLETAIYIVRSGLLEGKRLEALDFARRRHGVWWNGVLLFQNLFDDEVLLSSGGRGITPPPGMTLNELRQNLIEGRSSLAKFQDMFTTKGMVVRKALDAPRNDSIAFDVITFYKAYPTLFVAQQLLRRSTLSPLPKMALSIILSAFMDFTYNVVLALARGTLTLEDIEDKLLRKDPDYREFIKYAMRHPLTSNNLYGFILNMIVAAASGRTSGGVLNSVGEAGAQQWLDSIFALGKSLINNDTNWNQTTMEAYKVLGPFLGDLHALPVRLAVQEAWGQTKADGSSSKTRNQSLSALYNIMVNSGDEDANAVLRALVPNYPSVLSNQENRINGIPRDLQQAYLRNIVKPQQQQQKQKPLTEIQPQVQPQPQPRPEVKTKEPSLETQATTPIKAPM